MIELMRWCGIVSLALPLWAAAQTKPDVKAETVFWCIHQMGEYGSEAVDICVQEEMAAAEALAAYPAEVRDVVRACEKRAGGRGLATVRFCVDAELAAAQALAALPAEHRAVLDACRSEFGPQGARRVRQCVEERLAAPEKAE